MSDRKVMRWYITLLFAALWGAELAIVASVVYAVLTDHNAWPLVVLAVGFGLCMPFKERGDL